MDYEFACRTDCGRVRANNEDAALADPASGLAVLADGMGGYNAGEVASRMATRGIADQLGPWLAGAGASASGSALRQAVQAAIAAANRAVFDAAQAHPPYAGMGTTLVVCAFQPGRLVVGHIGDSRLYRLRAGALVRITRDHSLLQEQLDAGLITPQEAATSGYRNLVTRALGVEPSVVPDIAEHAVQPGDCYLLCSDGLSDMLTDEAIADLLAGEAPLAARAQALVEAANARGGRDNITVLLAQARGAARPRGLVARLLAGRPPSS